jgi:DNA-binding transcriptional LysR family regulator
VADVFRDPVDVAIRIGHFDDANYVALPLLEGNRRVLAASPGYLQRRGTPTRLEDLREHDCLVYQLSGRADRWSFEVDGRRSVIPVRGPLVCDDADVVRRWAVAGEGITYKSWLDLREDVLAGRLQLLLDGGSSIPLQLVCPHREAVLAGGAAAARAAAPAPATAAVWHAHWPHPPPVANGGAGRQWRPP